MNGAKEFAAQPKVELHCHLDGSISPLLLAQLYRQQHGDLPAGFAASVQAPLDCNTLTDYLRPFYVVLPLLQTVDALEQAAADVLMQQALDNVVYAELRFAPMSHTAGGLAPEQVVRAVRHGVRTAMAETGVQCGLLLCMMLGEDDERNGVVLDLAERYAGDGVVGVDIAGDENNHSASGHKALFQRAQAMEVPYTIHAGENGPASHVADALALGAKRIGHGVAIRGDAALMQQCREQNVLLEICATSNLQTKAVGSWQEFPFQTFLDAGVPVALSTDNRTVSGITLSSEYAALAQHFDSADEETFRTLNQSALQHSFASPGVKLDLLQKL